MAVNDWMDWNNPKIRSDMLICTGDLQYFSIRKGKTAYSQTIGSFSWEESSDEQTVFRLQLRLAAARQRLIEKRNPAKSSGFCGDRISPSAHPVSAYRFFLRKL